MKIFIQVIFLLSLCSCGFQTEVDLQISSSVNTVQSNSVVGSVVGKVVLNGNSCNSGANYRITSEHNGYFGVTHGGDIIILKDNPPLGNHRLEILGSCSDSSKSIAIDIKVIHNNLIPKHMVSIWRVGSVGYGDGANTITLPLRTGFNYSFTADWGDGSSSQITSAADPDITHHYSSSRDYTVTLTGTLEAWYFNASGDSDKILEVSELGDMGWINLESAFRGCDNLLSVSGGETSQVVNMSSLFSGSLSVVVKTSGWDTSGVVDMSHMFDNARAANPDTSSWDTSSVIDMSDMFSGALLADPDTSGWDTSSVIYMNSMFNLAVTANPDTSNWITSSVEHMGGMFQTAQAANPDTSGWDTSAVTSMANMFFGALIANPNTSGWDTSAVTTMAGMFNGAQAANPDTTGWDTSSVQRMEFMFYEADQARPNTSAWNTSLVTDTRSMFNRADLANPDMSSWDLSSVTQVVDMLFLANSLSNLNYTNFLIMLNNTRPNGGYNLGDIPAQYQAAAAGARANLLSPFSGRWSFTDRGPE